MATPTFKQPEVKPPAIEENLQQDQEKDKELPEELTAANYKDICKYQDNR